MKKLLIFFVLLSCTPDAVINYDATDALNSKAETELFEAVNFYRNSLWLPRIKTDELARQLAEQHNYEMIAVGGINHDNFASRATELLDNGVICVGEIVGYGYYTTEGILNAFKNSQSHNSILIGSFNYVGVSIIDNYYTLIFIRI